MFITTSRTEDYIKKLLIRCNITDPKELNIMTIAERLNIPVYYWEYSSETVSKGGKDIIFIDACASKQRQWEDFTHELCHPLWHVGRQEFLPFPFLELQEWQANNFSYHLAIPTFMLDKLYNYTVYDVMQIFNVEYDFAYKRLEMYKSKLYCKEGYRGRIIVGSFT
ncbi:ImmA/IrrE family metallo-endopeptidase [Virgibacillus sp. Bac332]|uniref:ImmA/IrrE family metallo-endopeptidase n=1 Tax=Virgibacillus sp. Bac332 TaxID=2419842 RepID=UPI000EF4D652|nr:ImmA/IrrE family metallo-endopeptidase [Virgibacillus sp. Bac332]